MFLELLTAGSSAVMVGAKRKQLKLSDVEQHVMGRRKLWFLHDHLAALSAKPKAAAAPKEGKAKAGAASKEGKAKGGAAAGAAGAAEPASGRRAITSFFGTKEAAPAADADAQMVDAAAAEEHEEEEE